MTASMTRRSSTPSSARRSTRRPAALAAALRWSVPAAAGHDDLVISAALVTALDGEKLRPRIAKGS